MNPQTLAFLTAYQNKMVGVHAANDVHALHDWLYDQYTAPFNNQFPHNNHYAPANSNNNLVAAVVADLNTALQLPESRRFQPHIPTAAVGNLSGLVFVSANPLVNVIPNLRENEFRCGSMADNREFCGNINTFHQIAAGGGANWWSHAIKLTHLCYTEVNELLPAPQRWPWVLAPHRLSYVGNIDLIPFHSPGDGFKLLNPNARAMQFPRQLAKQELLKLALSTLSMVLRLAPAPRLIFVGSPLGAQLMANHHEALGLDPRPNPANEAPPYHLLQRYEHQKTGARVMTFPRQIFTGFFNSQPPVGFTWQGLRDRMSAFANPTFPDEGELAL